MAVSSSRCLRLSKFLVPITLILLFSAYLFSTSTRIPFPEHIWVGEEKEAPKLKTEETPETKSNFITAAVEWEIDGSYNAAPLRDLCSSKKWTAGLIFKCDDAYGGVGNIRNIFLTCIRYAIEAGATALVVPQIQARDADLSNLFSGNTFPFSFMFDEEFFTASLSAACPQIRIIANESAINPAPANRPALTPKQLGTKFLSGEIDRVMDFAPEWRSLFDQWLLGIGAPSGFDALSPVLVSIRPSFFEWPILYDDHLFIATFGRILRFSAPILELAATVLYALDRNHTLGIDPARTGVPAAEKFYGAHLRTDVDAIAASFASYEEQSAAYLKEAQKKKLAVIYLASGSPPDVDRFTKTAAEKGIKVATKYALLEADPAYAHALAEMKALTWDQQALIDFVVLLRSSHFGGTWASSFSYNIVFKRHVAVGKGTWVPSKLALETNQHSKKDINLSKGECYKDEVNTVFGPKRMGLWFEMSMWP